MTSSTVRSRLVPHPTSAPGAVREISVAIAREGGRLLLTYELEGRLDALRLPPPAIPARADELWRHTCFEAFVSRAGANDYVEYNFAPSGQWAAYQFSGYRADMRPCDQGMAPSVRLQAATDHIMLTASVDLAWLVQSRGVGVRVGVTAVVEDRAGVLSYWALKHPAEKPDFHHADSFVLDL